MKKLFRAALIRALRTVFQTALGMVGAGAAMAEINWEAVAVASLLSGCLSLATSLSTGLPEAQGPADSGKGDST